MLTDACLIAPDWCASKYCCKTEKTSLRGSKRAASSAFLPAGRSLSDPFLSVTPLLSIFNHQEAFSSTSTSIEDDYGVRQSWHHSKTASTPAAMEGEREIPNPIEKAAGGGLVGCWSSGGLAAAPATRLPAASCQQL